MFKGSIVVLKGVRRNKLNTVTGQLATSINLDDDSTILWYMRLGHTGEKTL